MGVKMKKAMISAAALAMSVQAAPALAVTVINGGFEDSTASGQFETLGGSQLPGWTVTDTIDLIGSYWEGANGSAQSVDLAGNSPGAIQQTINGLIAGQVYRLSFFVSANPDNGPNPRLGSFAIGANNGSISVNTAGIGRPNSMLWRRQDYIFTGSGSPTVLSFAADPGSSAFGLALDDVSISAVPEPSTWAMLIFGFAGIGYMMRRRAKHVQQSV
jgi:choice-of-anchor C domain-containing protein